MTTATSERVYRLDRFTVPEGAREEFLSRVQETHDLLRTQPGFIQDFLLEQPAEGGTFKLVTLVEWESQAVIERAKTAVGVLHERTDFSPQTFYERLGVRPELGIYRRVR